MKIAVFSTKPYDRDFLSEANDRAGSPHELAWHEARLSAETSALAEGAGCVCAFVNDKLDRRTLALLSDKGVQLVALRSAGFNHVDLEAAHDLGIVIGRVPAYSPEAVAEHAVALILSLNRKIHRAYARVREGNFALEGLLGFNLGERTMGIVGLGQIGLALARIVRGFGCNVIAFDPVRNPELERIGGRYVDLPELLAGSDIISLHCPLTPETRHLIDERSIAAMRHGVMLINTSRGAVVDTRATINGLKSGQIGALALDVYEEEADLFFEDLSEQVIQDDIFARLLTFPNVLITAHQAFFTKEAMVSIAETTIANITSFEVRGKPLYSVSVERLRCKPRIGAPDASCTASKAPCDDTISVSA